MKHGRHALMSLVLAPVVPMAAVAAFPQIPGIDAAVQTTPGWVAVGAVWVWVTLWFLDRVGKLPGGSKAPQGPQILVVSTDDLRAVTPDRHKADEVHEIVSREDPEKPGYKLVWSSSKERRDLERKLDEHSKLMHATIETLDAMKRSLAALHKKVDEMHHDRRSA